MIAIHFCARAIPNEEYSLFIGTHLAAMRPAIAFKDWCR
jgi:hypothetical protein